VNRLQRGQEPYALPFCLSHWNELLFLWKYFDNLERREGLIHVIANGENNRSFSLFLIVIMTLQHVEEKEMEKWLRRFWFHLHRNWRFANVSVHALSNSFSNANLKTPKLQEHVDNRHGSANVVAHEDKEKSWECTLWWSVRSAVPLSHIFLVNKSQCTV